MKKQYRVHYIQHVDFEGLGTIENWGKANNVLFSVTKTYLRESFPDHLDFDMLIVLGGPFDLFQEHRPEWVMQELEFIRKVSEENKNILGICLGAQLLAEVLDPEYF